MSTDSIGSAGRDYATIADWWAGIPATLVENEIGEMYNDSEFVLTAQASLTGKTVGAFTIILQAATGQGFKDSKDVPGFKLSYVASQGVAIRSATGYLLPLILVNNGTATTLDGLQIKTSGSNSYPIKVTDGKLKNTILDSNGSTTGRPAAQLTTAIATNCLGIMRNAANNRGFNTEYGARLINCTAVRITGITTDGLGYSEGGGTTNILKNCASFGWSSDFTASGWDASSDYNASDSTNGPGANSVDSLTYADQFVSTTDDWRIKSGSGLIDTGNTDAANAPADIVGTTRGITVDGDIGCWEFVSAADTLYAQSIM